MHPFENEIRRRVMFEIDTYITQTSAISVVYNEEKMPSIQSDKTPFAAFLLVRVRVRRVVFTDHVFRVRERVPTDAGFFRPFCGGTNGRFASFFREFFLLDGRAFFPLCGEGWVRGESSNRQHGGCDERDYSRSRKNFENLASTSRVVCRRALFFARFSSSLSSLSS